ENLFHPRCVRNVAHHFCFRTGPDLFLHFHPHGLKIESHLLHNAHRHTLAQLDQAEQKMLGPDVVMVEAIRFFTRKLKDLLGARREVIHFSPARNYPWVPAPAPLYSYQAWGTISNARGLFARESDRALPRSTSAACSFANERAAFR